MEETKDSAIEIATKTAVDFAKELKIKVVVEVARYNSNVAHAEEKFKEEREELAEAFEFGQKFYKRNSVRVIEKYVVTYLHHGHKMIEVVKTGAGTDGAVSKLKRGYGNAALSIKILSVVKSRLSDLDV